jgi:tetratricopeptide (TPR) repeat protein
LKRPAVSPAVWLLSVLALVAGLGLVALSAWGRPIADGRRAADAGRLDEALAHYASGEARFNRVPFTKQLLPAVYHGTIANQLLLHYQLRNYDDLLEKAATSPSIAPVHFWAGSALFVKARDEEEPEIRLSWLGRAVEEFRQALELAPDDWDTKYNYELTSRLLDELRKQPKTPPKQMLQLLRPEPKTGGRPPRRVG